MYCEHCGKQLPEGAKHCPFCGEAVERDANPALPIQPNTKALPVMQSARRFVKSKKVVLIGALTVFLVVCGAIVAFFFLNHATVQRNWDDPILEKDGNVYYIGASNIVKLDSEDKASLVSVNSEGEKEYPALMQTQHVVSGDKIFTVNENNEIVKYTFISADTVKKENWMSTEELKKTAVAAEIKNSHSYIDQYTRGMICWQISGNEIFFLNMPPNDYLMEERYLAHKLGKINIDTKEITFLNNVYADCYTVDGDYIYYYDKGYSNIDEEHDVVDFSEAGIYKVRKDGTGKELIKKIVLGDKTAYRTNDDLCVYQDYIYFGDDSTSGKSRICRLSKDGQDMQYVTDESADDFRIDEKTGELYYKQGERHFVSLGFNKYYNRINLKTKQKEKLFTFNNFNDGVFGFYNGKLYIQNQEVESGFKIGRGEEKGVMGVKFDLEKKAVYYLYGNIPNELIDDGFSKKNIDKEPNVYWENMELDIWD